MRTRATNQAFVTLAQGMLAKATEHKDLLVKQGLSEGVLADIASALQEFEQTLEATRTARREHVGASGLLIPPGSALLERPAIQPFLGALDRAAFTYRWTHSDPRMDTLHTESQLGSILKNA